MMKDDIRSRAQEREEERRDTGCEQHRETFRRLLMLGERGILGSSSSSNVRKATTISLEMVAIRVEENSTSN